MIMLFFSEGINIGEFQRHVELFPCICTDKDNALK